MPQESIELLLSSRFISGDIDHAITQYEKLQRLHEQLERTLSGTPLKLNFENLGDITRRVSDLGRVVRQTSAAMVTDADRLAAAFAKAGDSITAMGLKTGSIKPDDALTKRSEQLKRVQEEARKAEEAYRALAKFRESAGYVKGIQAEIDKTAPLGADKVDLQAARMKRDLDEQIRLVGVHRAAQEALNREMNQMGKILNAAVRVPRPPAPPTAAEESGAKTAALAEKLDAAASIAPIEKFISVEDELRKIMELKTKAALAQFPALKQVGDQSKKTGKDVEDLTKKEKSLEQEMNRARDAAQAEKGLLLRKTSGGETLMERRQLGVGSVQDVRLPGTPDEKTVLSETPLSKELAIARERLRAYTVDSKAHTGELADKLKLTQDYIGKLDVQITKLKTADKYDGSPAVENLEKMKAQGQAAGAAIIRQMAAHEAEAESMQAALQKQVTTHEHLLAARRAAAQTRLSVADATLEPAEKVARLRKLAADDLRLARSVKPVDEKMAETLELRALAAKTEARRVETAETKRLGLEMERNERTRLREDGRQGRRTAMEQMFAKAAGGRATHETAMAGLGRNDPQRADLQEKYSAARDLLATEARSLGLAGQARRLENESLASLKDALGVRVRIAESQDKVVRQEFEVRDLLRRIPSTATPVGTPKVTLLPGGGQRENQLFGEDIAGGMRRTYTRMQEFGRAGEFIDSKITYADKALKNLNNTSDWSQRSFLKNTFVVTAWAASVGLLYGALNLLKSGAQGALDLERKTAVLKTVFDGTKDEAYLLRDEVMKLAVAYGRSSTEAVDAAVRFSRLGLTRVEVQTAVAASLRAANVAEISAAEAAENLSAIMAAFGLRAADLAGVLNQLNSISNTYNATNKDLLNGIARVGALASQAKLPLSDLMGMIATGVGTTGRPGAEFGNAIKALIVSISTPSIQGKLKENFDFDALTPTGEIKAMNVALGELYQKFMTVNSAQQQHLTQMLGQKQQASRLAAILENYVKGQALAIRALRDTNSAEQENLNIRATMISQLESLKAAFDRASVNMVASSDSSFVTNVIQGATRDLTFLLNLVAKYPAVTAAVIGMIGLMVVQMVRLAMASDAAGKSGSFLANTGKHVGMVFSEMRLAIRGVINQVGEAIPQIGKLSAKMNELATAGAASGGLNSWMVGINRIYRGALFAASAVASLAKGFGALLLLQGAFTAIAQVFGEDASAAEKAAASLAGYNEQVERAAKGAEALEKSAKLYEVVGKTISRRSPKRQKEDIESVAQAAEPLDVKKRAALVAELNLLAERERYTDLNARMGQLQVRDMARALAMREREMVLLRERLDIEEHAAELARSALDQKNATGKNPAKEREELNNILNRISQIQDRRGTLQAVTEEEIEKESSYQHGKLIEERMRLSNAALESGLKADSSLGFRHKLESEIQALKAKATMEAGNIARLTGETDAQKALNDEKAKAARLDLAAAHDVQGDKTLDLLQRRAENARTRVQAFESYTEAQARDVLLRTGKTEQQLAEGQQPGFWKKLGARGGTAYDAAYNALSGTPSGEGAARLRSLKEAAESLEMETDAKGYATDEAYYGKKRELALEQQMAAAAVERHKSQNKGYLELIALKQKMTKEAEKAASVEDQAGRDEIAKRKEALHLLNQTIQARVDTMPMQVRESIANEIEAKANRDAENARASFAVGVTELDQTFAQVDAVREKLIPETERRLAEARAADDKQEILRQTVMLEEQVGFLLTKQLSLEAQSVELQTQKSNELLKQNAEASKSFIMASRQEQLQAIAMKKYYGDREIPMEDLQFLSESAKQVGVKFLAGQMPGQLTAMGPVNRDIETMSVKFRELTAATDKLKTAFTGQTDREGDRQRLINNPDIPQAVIVPDARESRQRETERMLGEYAGRSRMNPQDLGRQLEDMRKLLQGAPPDRASVLEMLKTYGIAPELGIPGGGGPMGGDVRLGQPGRMQLEAAGNLSKVAERLAETVFSAPEPGSIAFNRVNRPELAVPGGGPMGGDVRLGQPGQVPLEAGNLSKVSEKLSETLAAAPEVMGDGVREKVMEATAAGMSEGAKMAYHAFIGETMAAGKALTVIDKPTATMFVWDKTGKMVIQDPVLLGKAIGDMEGRALGDPNYRESDSTTPAGLFDSYRSEGPLYGPNRAVFFGGSNTAIHDTFQGRPQENRDARLESETAEDNRISQGCINAGRKTMQRLQSLFEQLDDAMTFIVPENPRDTLQYLGRGSSSQNAEGPAGGTGPAGSMSEAVREAHAGAGAPNPAPQVNVQLGSVSVNFSDQFREIASGMIAQTFRQLAQPQIDAILTEVRRAMIPAPSVSNVAPQ